MMLSITDVREDKELMRAAQAYQKRACDSFRRLVMATDHMDGDAACKMWEAINKVLEMAELAADRS